MLGQIIVDYLRVYNLNYSYCVFLPDLKLSSDCILDTYEILNELDIRREDY